MRSLRVSCVLLALSVTLGACTGLPDGVQPVSHFDVQRYQGQWFEIMRLDHSFERGLTNVTATYTLRNDGSVGVLNRGLDRTDCRWKDADGRASFLRGPTIGSLSVTFFGPFAGGYHIMALDRDYQWALVSGPTRDYLWILARTPNLSSPIRNRLVAEARSLGFAVERLILVDQSKALCANGEAPGPVAGFGK